LDGLDEINPGKKIFDFGEENLKFPDAFKLDSLKLISGLWLRSYESLKFQCEWTVGLYTVAVDL
jgi:hypothetical protein